MVTVLTRKPNIDKCVVAHFATPPDALGSARVWTPSVDQRSAATSQKAHLGRAKKTKDPSI